MTLTDLFAASVRRVPDRPAIVFRDRRLTYRELDALAGVVAGLLRGAGIAAGDRVVLMSPTVPEFGVGYLGILTAGATVVPLNPLFKAEEVRYVLEDSGAAAMVGLEASLPLLRAARAGLGRGCPILSLDGPAGGEAGDMSFSEAAPAGLPVSAAAAAAEQVAVCLYTSGTTGRPKGALLSHANLIANVQSFRTVLHVSEEDVFLAALPLFHAYGATVLFLEPLSVG
ncbi:MAG: lcfB, partial [candidate division NC10 bacterium]|nr:lcfB [candidate division NC10 bacterium]